MLLLFGCLYFLVKEKRGFLKHVKKEIFWAKVVFFVVLLYEELSWLTSDMSDFFVRVNEQNEINFHNSYFFNNHVLLGFDISFIGLHVSISLIVFTYSFVLLLLGFGSYFKVLQRFKFMFLEKRYSIYFLAYTLPLIANSLATQYAFEGFIPAFNPECCELFIYTIFFLDILRKRRSTKMLVT